MAVALQRIFKASSTRFICVRDNSAEGLLPIKR
jgi:hypothetical protein